MSTTQGSPRHHRGSLSSRSLGHRHGGTWPSLQLRKEWAPSLNANLLKLQDLSPVLFLFLHSAVPLIF